MHFGCDLSIEEYAKDFEKLGYTHEESVELAKITIQSITTNDSILTKELTDMLYELAKTPIDIDEEFLNKFNSIGCTSFMLIPTQDKPIKIAYDNDCISVTGEENMIQINQNISSNMSNLSALDCSYMSDEEFEKLCKELN